MTLLDVKDLSVTYGDRVIVKDVAFSLEEGAWLMIAGPNGAGKSTVVNGVSGAVPYGGTVRCMGRELRDYRPGELARRIGVLAQNHFVGYAFTVGEVVDLGRYAYGGGVFRGRDDGGREAVERALRLTGLEELANRSVLSLSGGELQRVFLAQLFAQDPAVLILDEPTNHLDLVYQKQLLALVSRWLETPGRGVISVVHDLSLARSYGTDALLLHGGRKIYAGPIEGAFDPERLNAVYSMDVGEWMRGLLGQWR